jgi:hypothetical protein
MTEANSDNADVLKGFDTALWLLSARRQANEESPIDNQWLWDEIRQLGSDEDDPSRYLESIGHLIGALIEVSSFFLTGWAHSSGEDAETIIAVTRRICEDHYSNEPSSPGSSPEERP